MRRWFFALVLAVTLWLPSYSRAGDVIEDYTIEKLPGNPEYLGTELGNGRKSCIEELFQDYQLNDFHLEIWRVVETPVPGERDCTQPPGRRILKASSKRAVSYRARIVHHFSY